MSLPFQLLPHIMSSATMLAVYTCAYEGLSLHVCYFVYGLSNRSIADAEFSPTPSYFIMISITIIMITIIIVLITLTLANTIIRIIVMKIIS